MQHDLPILRVSLYSQTLHLISNNSFLISINCQKSKDYPFIQLPKIIINFQFKAKKICFTKRNVEPARRIRLNLFVPLTTRQELLYPSINTYEYNLYCKIKKLKVCSILKNIKSRNHHIKGIQFLISLCKLREDVKAIRSR